MDDNEKGDDNEEITDVPQNFKTWVGKNQDRIAKAEVRGTLPYFVRDNRERVRNVTKNGSLLTSTGGMKGGQHLGRKEDKEAYITYSKKGNSVTTLTDKQIENRNQLAEMLGIRKEEILPFMPHEDADAKNPNKNYKIGTPFDKNCQSCVVVYEARRRGLNVTALGYNDNPNSSSYILSKDCTLAFQGASAKIINPKGNQLSMKMIDKATKEQGRYFFGWDKEGADGHIIIAERMKDKTLVFYDPQDGSHWSENDILTNTRGFKVTTMCVNKLLMNNNFVKNLMRIS